MTDVTTTPTQEIALSYLKRINEDAIIEARTKEIAEKINVIFKNIYHINNPISLNYTCFFVDKKLIFKLYVPDTTISLMVPSIPESCLWNDTDLHIGLNLLQSDLEETYKEFKKIAEKELNRPLSLWEKFKNWL